MSRVALICLVVSGCFYADPINQRPALDIKQNNTGLTYRNSLVDLEAIANDPEADFVTFTWRAYACIDQTDCDQAPFYTGVENIAKFMVPPTRTDVAVPVQAVLVLLEGKDAYGAVARPVQQLVIAVADHAPDVELRKDSRFGYVVNTPLNIYAKVGDIDDGPADPEITWTVFRPANNPDYTLIDYDVEPDGSTTHVQVGKTFTPAGIGEWNIEVTATDSLGAATTQTAMINVTPDNPPCLSQLSPIVAPPGTALPLAEPTLFQVMIVRDDLDPYPTVPDNAGGVLGTTSFSWSILPPGAGTWQALTGITGNRVGLDPANYAPGSFVELRVEIFDRKLTPITCAPSNATCSVISDAQCLQRQTWRVEVR